MKGCRAMGQPTPIPTPLMQRATPECGGERLLTRTLARRVRTATRADGWVPSASASNQPEVAKAFIKFMADPVNAALVRKVDMEAPLKLITGPADHGRCG
jgi:hypothetical protein